MDKKIFIEKFIETVEIESVSNVGENTKFRELEEWNSLAVLSVIVLLDEEYGIQIENSDFKKLNTIGDIISYIESK